jgi:crotonobetainyl-CoA:carnitine CoA-transferase CaiB-like acyl-CoA transferase
MERESGGERPLSGIRVLDFSRVLAGPYLGQILAALGADVVKIEPPDGDPTRRLGEPLADGVSYYFCGTNGGKRSIVLDLKNPRGLAVAGSLFEKADVAIENFRSGVFDRLGFGREFLERCNPELVLVSISGLGADAEERERPSFDLCTQARGGTLSINGYPGELPVRLAIPMGDLAGSFYGAIALLGCLLKRERLHARGEAMPLQHVDLSLLDAQLALLGNWVPFATLTKKSPGPVGGAHTSAAPYDVYESADSPFVVAVFTENFWRPFLAATGLDSLRDDGRFMNSASRVAHRAELDAILRPHFKTAPRSHWLARLAERGVPCEPVQGILEALADPAVAARGSVKNMPRGRNDTIPQVAFPAKVNGNFYYSGAPPTALGGDETAVFRDWLGVNPSEVESWRSEGAFGDPAPPRQESH